MRERLDDIGRTLTREQGKPLPDALKEIRFACDVVDYYADLAPTIGGGSPPTRSPVRSLVLRQPVGVVVAIVPWNYPIDLLSWKIGPALAAGCTVVAKPPSHTPLAARSSDASPMPGCRPAC